MDMCSKYHKTDIKNLLNKENKNRNDNEENPYLLKTYYEGEIEISPLFKA